MKFSMKLPLLMSSVLLCMAAAGLACILIINSATVSFTHSMESLSAMEVDAANIQISFKKQVQEWKNVLIRGENPEKLKKYWNAFQREETAVADASAVLLARLPEGPAKVKLADFIAAHKTMGRGYRQGYEAYTTSGFKSSAGDKKVSGMDRGPTKMVAEVGDLVIEQFKEGAAKAEQQQAEVIKISIAGLLLASLVGVFASVLISRSVVKQLGGEPDDVRNVAAEISKGNLSAKIHLRDNDSTSILATMSEMRESLVRLVQNVRISSQAISNESTAIASGSDNLAKRRECQKKALAESSDSIQQLGVAVKYNTEHAKQANELARGSSDVASKGREVVSNVVTTMSAINESSNKIADIITVIDGIAFQTNLLALNAAVEAARAGEQGRGFAVVATEVRSLAQRSASAADEIKALITDSVQRVEQGSVFVDQAGSTMEDIVTSIQKVTDMMGEITSASAEQDAGVTQVEQSIGTMGTLTSENGQLVEESVTAAGNLNREAQKLDDVVSTFDLGHMRVA